MIAELLAETRKCRELLEQIHQQATSAQEQAARGTQEQFKQVMAVLPAGMRGAMEQFMKVKTGGS